MKRKDLTKKKVLIFLILFYGSSWTLGSLIFQIYVFYRILIVGGLYFNEPNIPLAIFEMISLCIAIICFFKLFSKVDYK